MKRIGYMGSLLIGLFIGGCLTGCSKDDRTEPSAGVQVEQVKLLVTLPATALGTRLGDPGVPVDEGADWNVLSVILAYTDDSPVVLPNGSKVQVSSISKEDFEALPFYEGSQRVRLLTIDAQPGKAYIYGLTYSSEAVGEADLSQSVRNCRSNEEVQALPISNEYAGAAGSADYAKLVSVATGYYRTTESGDQPAMFTIQEGGTGVVGNIPAMTLTRLATKLDVQWDAADAYENGYTDVLVTGFTYAGKEYGRLFPQITAAGSTGNSDQSWTFYNTSPISQRNGRVYHYTFTDGVSVPKITFSIEAKQSGSPVNKPFSMNFRSPLLPAAWYKVNAAVKGLTGSGDITLDMNGSGT